MVPGYEFGLIATSVMKRISDRPKTARAQLGELRTYKGGHVGMQIHSDVIDEDLACVKGLMSEYGLKGLAKKIGRPHITLAEVPRGMSRNDKEEMFDSISSVMPTGATVTLGQVAFYPEHIGSRIDLAS
jgi:hypothetical protein